MIKCIATSVATLMACSLCNAAGDFVAISNAPTPVKLIPGPAEIPEQFPELDTITSVEFYRVNWVGGEPNKVGRFSVTNAAEITKLYGCLQTDLVTPCTLSLAGYAGKQKWYSGTNVVLRISLLNLHSSLSFEFRGSADGRPVFGKSDSFAATTFRLHAAHLPGFAERYRKHFASGESLAGDKHSFWDPSKQWEVQHPPGHVR